MKSQDNQVNSEGMYIYKLYKKNKLPLEKVELYLKKLCVCVFIDECNVSIILKNYENQSLSIMMSMVDNIIKNIVINKLYISSLRYISCRPFENSLTNQKLYDFLKNFKVYNYQNLNVTSIDYEKYWWQMLLN